MYVAEEAEAGPPAARAPRKRSETVFVFISTTNVSDRHNTSMLFSAAHVVICCVSSEINKCSLSK